MTHPCIIPVAAADALAWAEGRLKDPDLLLRAPLVPEAIFIANLPDRAAYSEMLEACIYWRQRGAVCMIARTGNQVVVDHWRKNGGLAVLQEAGKKYRLFLPPGAFWVWLSKFDGSRRSAPNP